MGSVPWSIWKTPLHWWLGSLKVERYHSFQPTMNGFWHCSPTVPLVQHQNLTASRPLITTRISSPSRNIPETHQRQCEPSKSVPNTKTKWVFTSSQPKTPHKRKVSPFFSTHLHFVGHRAPGWWLKDLCSFYSTSEIEVSTMDASPYRLMWFQASKPELSQIGTKYYPPKEQ